MTKLLEGAFALVVVLVVAFIASAGFGVMVGIAMALAWRVFEAFR